MPRRLKAFLLCALFVVAWVIVTAALAALVVSLKLFDIHDRSWRPAAFMFIDGVGAAAAIFATWLVALIGHRRFGQLGYAARHAVRELATGSLFGLGAIALLMIGIATLGGFTFGMVAMSGSRLATYTLGWLIAFFAVGLAEEAGYRAVALITLGEAIGFWPAAIITSLLFSAEHYFLKGPTENIADALSIALLALFLCLTVLRTGAIWFAVGFHALFDYAGIFLFGAPNSGNNGQPIVTRLLTGSFHGPAWLTGGPLGVEASWLIFPVIALLFLAFSWLYRTVGYNPPAQFGN